MALKNVEDIYPLSPMQQGMLFHTLSQPDADMYFEQLTFLLEGSLQPSLLAQAWQQTVERHAVLRSAFIWKGLDQLVQVVRRSVTLPWRELDWRDLSAEQQRDELARLLTGDREQGFELGAAPLMRCALVRLRDDAHQFVWSCHHMLVDGWSVANIFKEVGLIYSALLQGEAPRLPEPRPYRDFIAWLKLQNTDRARVFWQQMLRDFTAPTALRIERTAAAEGTVYEAEQIWLSKALTQALQSFARRQRLTLNILLQGAWALLLSRYSGERDVLFGVTVAGRPTDIAEVESMVGLFVNTLPLRVHTPPDAELTPWLGELHQRLVEIDQYAYCPLVEIQEWSDIPRGTPLFHSMVAFENYPLDAPPMAQDDQLRISGVEAVETTNYPITVLAGAGEKMFIRIRYDAGRYEAAAIRRLLSHLQALLEGFIANPRRYLSHLALLPAGERQQLLALANRTPLPTPDLCIHQLFEAQVQRTPDAVAVSMTAFGADAEPAPRQISYRELNQRANRLARQLRALGVGPETTVGICSRRTLEMMIGMLAVFKAGGAYLPLDPEYPPQRLELMLADSQARVLLTETALSERLPGTAQRVLLDQIDEQGTRQRAGNLDIGVQPANLAYLIYTSGSTGRPKGVAITHANAVAFLTWAAAEFPPELLNGVLASTSICFDLSIFELFTPLAWGGRVVLAQNALDLTFLADSPEVSLVNTVPSAMAELMNGPGLPASAHTVNLAGEPLPRALVRKIYRQPTVHSVVNLYGPSEYTTYATVARMARDDERPPVIGEPVANTRAYLLDHDLQLAPIGVPGELFLGGAGLARGYFNRPELTAERFVPDPFGREPGARLYRTGDLARRLPAADDAQQTIGPLDFLGRGDHQIKLRGFRIETGEIEALLEQHPEVDKSVVLARKTPAGEWQLAAYVAMAAEPPDSMNAAATDPIELWQQLWDQTYSLPANSTDPTFNTVGWISSYTGQPIAAAEMREWLDGTVERILAGRPGRVLEIGCGTGMLLFRIAPHCAQYTAMDLSAEALHHIENQLDSELAAKTTLLHRPAHALDDFTPQAFDTVVLNSVVQYFPSIEYLIEVLQRTVQLVAPGGMIFIGDVRHAGLLEALHASIQFQRAPAALTPLQLRQRVRRQLERERELLIDPGFFHAFAQDHGELGPVRIELKRGRYHNELTRFRYDVVLPVGAADQAAGCASLSRPTILDWQTDWSDSEPLRRLLTQEQPPSLVVQAVPNARLSAMLQLTERLATSAETAQIGAWRDLLQEHGLEPEDFYELGRALDYGVAIGYSAAGTGLMDILFYRPADAVVPHPTVPASKPHKPYRNYCNDPLRGDRARRLTPQLRAYLAEKVPDHMVPAAFVVLDALPLTPNGKIDRKALPAPEDANANRLEGYLAPRDDLEFQLVQLWERVLAFGPIGVRDMFFEIGGHSILALRLVALIEQELGRPLPLTDLLHAPTVEQQAAVLRQQAPTQPWSPLVPIQPKGDKAPLFCVHPGGGMVLDYVDLARHLGSEQPVYGLQAQGLEAGQEPHERIEDMAACYIDALVKQCPQGPFLLAGWSAGGRVIFEMAQQLIARDRPPALLIFIDCFAPTLFADDIRLIESEDEAAYIARTWSEDVPLSVEQLRTFDTDGRIRYLMERLEEAGLLPPGIDLARARRLVQVKRSTSHIGLNKTMKPLPVPLPVALFRAEQQPTDRTFDEPTVGWEALCPGGVTVYWTPGDHRGVLREPNVRTLAEKLKTCCEQIQIQTRAAISPKE